MATELMSYELEGVKPEWADWISNESPRDFVWQSMLKKVSSKNAEFSWQIDNDDPVDDDNALMEGFDFDDLDDTFTKTTKLTGWCQKMGRAVKVTKDADAQDAWGRGKESTYQTDKKLNSLKRDFEYALLNNGASVAEVKGTSPRMLGGFKSMVSSLDGGTTISAEPLTGAITYITSTSDVPTEQDIKDALAQLWKAGARPEILMCSETMKDTISGMQEGTANRARIFENTPKISFEVNTITDELGQTVKVVFNRLMPANTVYICNPDDWQIMVFRALESEVQGKKGDYKKGVLHFDQGQRHRNPWASAVIVPKPAA